MGLSGRQRPSGFVTPDGIEDQDTPNRGSDAKPLESVDPGNDRAFGERHHHKSTNKGVGL